MWENWTRVSKEGKLSDRITPLQSVGKRIPWTWGHSKPSEAGEGWWKDKWKKRLNCGGTRPNSSFQSSRFVQFFCSQILIWRNRSRPPGGCQKSSALHLQAVISLREAVRPTHAWNVETAQPFYQHCCAHIVRKWHPFASKRRWSLGRENIAPNKT